MLRRLSVVFVLACCATVASAQTAEDIVARNLQAKGGLEKIKAITSEKMSGRMKSGDLIAQVTILAKAPDLYRTALLLQGMSLVRAYDGDIGWQINPFGGRKDPEMLGEEDVRDLAESADFYGPLVDYQQKGNTVAYLGQDTIDGDAVHKLKVTLKNGDIWYYYIDPDSMLEIRVERQQFVRGAVHETRVDVGSYKQVNGVYFPFSVETKSKDEPDPNKITFETITANVPINDSEFKMPSGPAVPSPQKQPEPPAKQKEKVPAPPKPPKP